MSSRFVLVGGMPSSGSTLLSSLLDGHSDILCGPETSLYCDPCVWRDGPGVLAEILSSERQTSVPWGVPDQKSLSFYGWDHRTLIRMAGKSPDMNHFVERFYRSKHTPAVVVDKTPQNLYAIDQFLQSGDDLRSIVTVRSPELVVDSLRRRGLDPRICVAVWLFDAALTHTLAEQYVPTGQMLVLRYENLVTNPSTELARVCQFLGVAPSLDDMLERRHSKRPGNDSSLVPNGHNAASSWRLSAVGDVSKEGLVAQEPLSPPLRSLLCEGGADPEDLNEFVQSSSFVRGRELMEYFEYGSRRIWEKRDSTFEMPVIEGNATLSRFERFYLGKITRHAPNSVRIKLERSTIVVIRKSMSVLVLLVLTLDRSIKWCLSLFVRLATSLISSPSTAKGWVSFVAQLPHRAWRRLCWLARATSLFPLRVLTRLTRLANRLLLSGVLGRLATRLALVRDRVIGEITVRHADATAARIHPVASHARVRLPAEKYDVVGVIAFHGRNEILSVVVDEALKVRDEGVNAGVILACSDDADVNFAGRMREQHEHVGIVMTENRPLGRKWQRGVDCARLAQPDFLYITGSDDVISKRFILNNIRIMERRELLAVSMVGPRTWYILDLQALQKGDESSPFLWQISYHNGFHRMPLGAGRIYSSMFLDGVDWQIFEQSWDRLLDDKGYNLAVENGGTIYNPTLDDGFVLSVKGNWNQMNTLEEILQADSVISNPMSEEQVDAVVAELGDTWNQIRGLANPQRAPSVELTA